ncbi:MAG: hypothetical protein AB7F40_07195 [Victivallaceae bacterium]|nr:hypothetical protein [Victivallaceae bacterium]
MRAAMKSSLILALIFPFVFANGQNLIKLGKKDSPNYILNDCIVEVTVMDKDDGVPVGGVVVCGAFVIAEPGKFDCKLVWGTTDSTGNVSLCCRASYYPGTMVSVVDDYWHDYESVSCVPGKGAVKDIYKPSSRNKEIEFPSGEKTVDVSKPWRAEIEIKTRKKRHPVAMAESYADNPVEIKSLDVAMPFDLYASDFVPPYGKSGRVGDLTITVSKKSTSADGQRVEYNIRYDFANDGDGVIEIAPVSMGAMLGKGKFTLQYEAPVDGYAKMFDAGFVYDNQKGEMVGPPRPVLVSPMADKMFRLRSRYDERGNLLGSWYGIGALPGLEVKSGKPYLRSRHVLLNPLSNSLEYNGITPVDIQRSAAYEYEWSVGYKVRYFRDFMRLAWMSSMYRTFSRDKYKLLESEWKKASRQYRQYQYPVPEEYQRLIDMYR